MYQIGICSQDKTIPDKIGQSILSRYPVKVYKYVSANELLQEMGHQICDVDILLLDIWDSEDSIKLAKNIQEKNRCIMVIFIAGNISQAVNIFEADPIYLLIKPISRKKLYRAMDKAFQKLQKYQELEFRLYCNKRLIRIPYEHIFYIESEKRYLFIHHQGGTEKFSMKLSELMQRLPSFFVRCHQSYAVNIYKMVKFEKSEIIIENGVSISVSRSRQAETAYAIAALGNKPIHRID